LIDTVTSIALATSRLRQAITYCSITSE